MNYKTKLRNLNNCTIVMQSSRKLNTRTKKLFILKWIASWNIFISNSGMKKLNEYFNYTSYTWFFTSVVSTVHSVNYQWRIVDDRTAAHPNINYICQKLDSSNQRSVTKNQPSADRHSDFLLINRDTLTCMHTCYNYSTACTIKKPY